jgi:hypothetical protein
VGGDGWFVTRGARAELAHVDRHALTRRLTRIHRRERLAARAHVFGAVEELEDDRGSLALVEEHLQPLTGTPRRRVALLDPSEQSLHPLGGHVGEPDHPHIECRGLLGPRRFTVKMRTMAYRAFGTPSGAKRSRRVA